MKYQVLYDTRRINNGKSNRYRPRNDEFMRERV